MPLVLGHLDKMTVVGSQYSHIYMVGEEENFYIDVTFLKV